MSPLATAIYKVLRSRVVTDHASITYGELAKQVSKTVPVHHRSSKLHEALGEITHACHHAKLPAIPAIVWRADSARPSDGYFAAAHPRVRTDDGRIAAWEAEHERVIRAKAKYPPVLS